MTAPSGTPLTIRLLGGFQICRDDRPIAEATWCLRGAKDLVKILALAPGHQLTRDQIIEAL